MQIQSQTFTLPNSPLTIFYFKKTIPENSISYSNRSFNNLHSFAGPKSKWNCHASCCITGLAFKQKGQSWQIKKRTAVCSATTEEYSISNLERKRKVVEHVCLLKMKDDLSEDQEQTMLDYLYTTQYQMRGIVSISLGRLCDDNIDNYTHAIYIRFQRKEDLSKFYENPFYAGVMKDHVMPYCHGITVVDFESEVEDDILPIFRKGEEFNSGVEFILLVSCKKSSSDQLMEDALTAFTTLTEASPSLIVQATKGSNFNHSNKEYTDALVVRFRSMEAFQIFMKSTEYANMWRSKFEPIIQKFLSVHFSVDPVGTELM